MVLSLFLNLKPCNSRSDFYSHRFYFVFCDFMFFFSVVNEEFNFLNKMIIIRSRCQVFQPSAMKYFVRYLVCFTVQDSFKFKVKYITFAPWTSALMFFIPQNFYLHENLTFTEAVIIKEKEMLRKVYQFNKRTWKILLVGSKINISCTV